MYILSEKELKSLRSQVDNLKETVKTLTLEKKNLQDQLKYAEMNVEDGNQKYASLEKEQEQLLIELAEMELETNNLKARLSILEKSDS